MKDLIFELCKARGVSGDESEVLKVAAKYLKEYADVEIDRTNNNLIATFGNKTADKHIMLDAHIDGIGLIVKYIDDNGFIFYDTCGGMDAKALSGSVVEILGKEKILGVIGITPPHLMKGKDTKTLPAPNELFVDTGMTGEEVKSIVSIGDRIAFAAQPHELVGNRITSPTLDNRVSVATLIETASLLKDKELNCKVSIALTSNEEINSSGAITAAYNVNPDQAIILDVSFATSDGVSETESVPFGSGAMIGISPSISNEMRDSLEDLAKKNKIPYVIEAMGSKTGTNTDDINVSRGGVKTGLISIPLKYMHTPVEVVDIDDTYATAKLISLYIEKYSEEMQ